MSLLNSVATSDMPTSLSLCGLSHNQLKTGALLLQGVVEQYQGSAILEVQARSCEYSHMFKLDGMRAALLEHIPPLDESTYTRNLGNSQVIDAAGAAQVSHLLQSAAVSNQVPADAVNLAADIHELQLHWPPHDQPQYRQRPLVH